MANEMTEIKVPKRILNTLLTSLTAGVVPRSGAPYIAIGRQEEINSLLDNLDETAQGGAFTRFLIGRYGSGKSFLLQLIRGYALEKGFICADADLSPERRLTGGSGAGLATYKELMINIATKASPDGNGLPTILSRYLTKIKMDLTSQNILPDSVGFENELKKRVFSTLAELEGDVGGFDFARVLGEYFVATLNDDAEIKSACLRWIRGEYSTKTEAKNAMGFSVSSVIDDDNWYNFIKLIASLSVKFGYSGFVIFIDECVNLYKIPNRISREANYEKILTIFNDTLQGKVSHLAVLFGGTPQFLEDTRRGLFSYDALKSRLADSKYADMGFQNLSSPVIRLRRLSENELLALVKRLTKLYMQREDMSSPPVSDSQIQLFMSEAMSRAGAEEMITPREIIRDFLTLLNILRDNPSANFDTLVENTSFARKEEEQQVEEFTLSAKNKISLFDIDI